MRASLLLQLLRTALAQAQSQEGSFPEDRRRRHAERSKFWVGALHEALHGHYPGADVRVFSKYRADNKSEFGLNELLYDLTVCEVGTVLSARRRKKLRYVKRVLWQVESEFANNSSEALRDFNKLVLGSAENKLFIGGSVSDNEGFIEVLRPAAAACSGQVFAALVPHPSAWNLPVREIRVWSFAADAWRSVELEDPV